MSLFAVRYTYDGQTDLRLSVRPEHRAWLGRLADAGRSPGSGPFTDDGDPGALLIFEAEDRTALDTLLAEDPFARAGVIAATDVRQWNLATGPWADVP